MSFDRRFCGLTLVALFAAASPAAAAPPVLGPEVERDVVAPEGKSFEPAPADEEGAIDRFAGFTMALAKRDYEAAYAMLRLSFQASNPRLEWEMNLRKRTQLWADGTLRILRLTWRGSRPACMPLSIFGAIARMARWIAAMSSSIAAPPLPPLRSSASTRPKYPRT